MFIQVSLHFNKLYILWLKFANYALNYAKLNSIMPALCFMLSVAYYAENNAGIIDASLVYRKRQKFHGEKTFVVFMDF